MNVKRFALGPILTNVYLVSDKSGAAVLIDPAAETPVITDWIKANGLELKAVLLTHGHIDHVSGLGENCFSDTLGGEIYLNRSDSEMVTSPDKEIVQMFGFNFGGISSFKEINDGDELSFGDIKVKVMTTPGHTEGSVCFLIGEGDGDPVLFSGDTLFARSVGRTDLPGGDSAALKKSMIKFTTLSPELVVYPGHGPSTTIYDEMQKNPFWPR